MILHNRGHASVHWWKDTRQLESEHKWHFLLDFPCICYNASENCRSCFLQGKQFIVRKFENIYFSTNSAAEGTFSNFPCMFLNPNNLNSKCSNLLDLRNLQEQVKNGILLAKLFWPTMRKNCSSVRKKIEKKVCKFEAVRPRICNVF